MKTLKVMSIIGIVLAVLSFFCEAAFNNYYQYVSGIGWGMYASLYLLAFAIVGVVQAARHTK